MTTIINGSSPSITFSDNTTQSTAGLPLTGGNVTGSVNISGDLGVGNTSPSAPIDVVSNSSAIGISVRGRSDSAGVIRWMSNDGATVNGRIQVNSGGDMIFQNTNSISERMRINSDGNVLVGTTTYSDSSKGILLSNNGRLYAIAEGNPPITVNRLADDGNLILLNQAGVTEGTISVSGTTVSYNGGHLSRWSQLPDGLKDDTLLKGTVMSNLDDMCVWEKDGVVAENEQLNKMKVSDVVGDTNVAGVFVNWTMDERYGVDDMNVAMTGDMIIRIADGVVVQKGDLLMSAGDGTAKPQGDDIVRSKTVAKVTSNYITCTYADGSYCVPCVLMAC
jgi:hypothetical protein